MKLKSLKRRVDLKIHKPSLSFFLLPTKENYQRSGMFFWKWTEEEDRSMADQRGNTAEDIIHQVGSSTNFSLYILLIISLSQVYVLLKLAKPEHMKMINLYE